MGSENIRGTRQMTEASTGRRV